jgi:hypothetical protein
VLPPSAALMMEEARTSEASVDNYFTRQYIPEDKSELHSRRRENLKSSLIVRITGSFLLLASERQQLLMTIVVFLFIITTNSFGVVFMLSSVFVRFS